MNRHLRGFTVTELVVTMAIAMFLVAAGAPALRSLLLNNKVATQTNDLISTFNVARSEAVKQGRRTTVCVSSDEATCTGETNWSLGWLVWVDSNGNGTRDANETRRIRKAVDPAIDLVGVDNISSLGYSANGFLTIGVGNALSFALCDKKRYPGEDYGRVIVLSGTGRPTIRPFSGGESCNGGGF